MGSVKGLAELNRKLATLESKLAGRVLRSATMLATTPALKAMRQAAPRGKQAHRTYKGNLVAPGFLSRSLKRKSSYRGGKARVEIGVKKEAFYGLNFVEKGTRPHEIRARKKRGMSGMLRFGGRYVKSVKHPGARAKPWFVSAFEKQQKAMLFRLKEQLGRKIERHMQ